MALATSTSWAVYPANTPNVSAANTASRTGCAISCAMVTSTRRSHAVVRAHRGTPRTLPSGSAASRADGRIPRPYATPGATTSIASRATTTTGGQPPTYPSHTMAALQARYPKAPRRSMATTATPVAGSTA